MIDLKELFERQARWQRARAKLSWAEKLRMAETLRSAAQMMARGRARTSLEPESAGEGRATKKE